MKPTTISLLQKYKQEKKRFATITAYDYSFVCVPVPTWSKLKAVSGW